MDQQQTLAKMVRAKYPGAYDDLSDQDLEKAVKAKYPGTYDDIPLTQASTPEQTPKPQTRAAGFAKFGDLVIETAKGAAKGAGSTVLGLSQLINKGTAAVGLSDPIPNETWDRARKDFTTPQNTAQSVGKGAEQIGEFFVPGGIVGRGAKALTTGSKVANVAVRAGLEGASTAAVHSAQTGSTEGAKFAGGAAAAAAAVSPAAGKALSWLGERVERALVKATKADIQNGFQVNNVYKHQLGGSLEQTIEKSDAKLKDLGQQLKAELTAIGPNGKVPQVDVYGTIDEAAKELRAKAARNFGQNPAIERAIDGLQSELKTLPQTRGGFVDLHTANQIKQGVGELGAWEYGKVDPDAKAKEIVANLVYSKLRAAIEKAAPDPGRIKELNKAMGEIIPIRTAVMRRIPVEQRQNVINLGDMIGVGTGAWLLPIFNRILRSGQAADVMVKTGQKATGTVLSPVTGAVASQIKR